MKKIAANLNALQPCPRILSVVRDADYPSLTPKQLADVGQALFGAGWRAALAGAFAISETDNVMVESGQKSAPHQWRAKLVALAQDRALRAMDAASSLLWREEGDPRTPLYAPQPPRFV